MARTAEMPILFVGKPDTEHDPYWKQFHSLMDNPWVKYHPHVGNELDMVRLLQSARGFVLVSVGENWCLSAREAVACGLPLLVPDQNWSRERFGSEAHSFDKPSHRQRRIELLRQFYRDCPSLPAPKVRLYSWLDVAQRLTTIYESVCASR
jgi:glycosyltransferase involved in cell wall biosynthesis